MRVFASFFTFCMALLWVPGPQFWEGGIWLPAQQPLVEAKADPLDQQLFQEKYDRALSEQSTAGRALSVARSFLGAPYVPGTLNRSKKEALVVNLRQLDCWTFVENSVAIAKASDDAPFDSFVQHLQQLRYWGGAIKGYGSRIHYFSGWLLQAEKTGYLTDLTKDFGGIPLKKSFFYISAHPEKYPRLADPDIAADIKAQETRISRHPWHFIPKAKIKSMEHLIQDGDIIAITSWKAGLDIAHEGFALRQNDRIYLIHASSLGKRVIISRQPLHEYLATQKGQTGIMVARLQ